MNATKATITNKLLSAGINAIEGWDAVVVLNDAGRILAEIALDGTVTPGTVEGSDAMVARVVAALAA